MRQHFALLLAVFLGILAVGSAAAHPVPSDTHDRTIVVRLSPDLVIVKYRLEVDYLTAQNDLPRSEIPKVTGKKEFGTVFTTCFAKFLAGNLVAELDGKELTFTCDEKSYELTDHVCCDFSFRATCSPSPRERHTFSFREGNYEHPVEDHGKLRLELTGGFQVSLQDVAAPDEALMNRPYSDWKPGDGERRRKVSATFTISEVEKAAYKPALPPDLEPPKTPPAEGVETGTVKPGTGPDLASAKPWSEVMSKDETDTSAPRTLLHLLLDTKLGVATALLLAAFFGAAHALTPGHGKTLVAAYLVGERGTIWHALFLGLMTTLSHTWAVLAVAILVTFFPTTGSAVEKFMPLVGGLLVAGLGFWLLLRRLAGQADHVHFGSGHHHHHHDHSHGHGHSHGFAGDAPGWRALVMLGITGGIVPCVDAVLLLVYAITAGLVAFALPLLLAFSTGLAGVLVALGVGVVWAKNWASVYSEKGGWIDAVMRSLPLLSAAAVTVLGLWLCYDSVRPR
jgi:ABC-type nickel/cobalt efflux system permease component RcnA